MRPGGSNTLRSCNESVRTDGLLEVFRNKGVTARGESRCWTDRQHRLVAVQCGAWRWGLGGVSKGRCGWRRRSCQSHRHILIYARLNTLLEAADFDRFVEGQCAKFYAPVMGRPSLAPGRYFRLLLVGYFEGIG